jgi:hypothetical protein
MKELYIGTAATLITFGFRSSTCFEGKKGQKIRIQNNSVFRYISYSHGLWQGRFPLTFTLPTRAKRSLGTLSMYDGNATTTAKTNFFK